MKRETTPRSITAEIKKFCQEISDAEPLYVPVYPAPGMQYLNCFLNVSDIVSNNGGTQINGWAIWQFANVYVYFEAHSVWQNDVGALIDPTPHIDGETQILFLPDKKVRYSGNKIPGKRIPLTDSPLAKEYIELATKIENYIIYKYDGNKISSYNPDFQHLKYARKRSQELLRIFQSKANRNDLCPCGSGLKYKKCCGRFD